MITPQDTVAWGHSQIITFEETSFYDAMSSKKFRLNDGVSYRTVFMLKQPTFITLANTEDILNNHTKIINSKDCVKQEENKSHCSLRSAPRFNPSKFQFLKDLLQKNACELRLQEENSYGRTIDNPNEFRLKSLVSETIEFIENYKPTWFTGDREISDSPQIKVDFKPMSEETQLKIQKALKNMFYMYLNGDYRGINESFSISDKTQESWENATNNRYVSYKYKSKHINFDFTPNLTKIEESEKNNKSGLMNIQDEDDSEEVDNINNPGKKQVIYNKSKYVMQFLLKLLDPEHLEYLNIPGGLEARIGQIQKNIRESSKRNKLSQSQFYNHTHFDCLFLQQTQQNSSYILQNKELQAMQKLVFCENFEEKAAFAVNTLNLYKRLVSQIILAQVNLIRSEIIPQLAVYTLSFKSASKLKYFERICDSISKLNSGAVINKF